MHSLILQSALLISRNERCSSIPLSAQLVSSCCFVCVGRERRGFSCCSVFRITRSQITAAPQKAQPQYLVFPLTLTVSTVPPERERVRNGSTSTNNAVQLLSRTSKRSLPGRNIAPTRNTSDPLAGGISQQFVCHPPQTCCVFRGTLHASGAGFIFALTFFANAVSSRYPAHPAGALVRASLVRALSRARVPLFPQSVRRGRGCYCYYCSQYCPSRRCLAVSRGCQTSAL